MKTDPTLICGDCLVELPKLPADHFDSAITDPPYHLKRGDADRGFMNQEWDGGDVAFRPDTWRAVLRVCKPGAYLLAFGGTRTFHRLTCAIEDAGWIVQDCISWLYGSGFPKSLDISKAIDKRRPDDVRPVCRYLRAAMESRGLTSNGLAIAFSCHSRLIDHWAARDSDSQPTVPTIEQWLKLKTLLALGDEMDAEVIRLNERKGTPGDDWYKRELLASATKSRSVTGAFASNNAAGMFSAGTREVKTTAPATSDAKIWNGWGTALKPAWEPIVVAMKPTIGPYARNAIRHGVAGLNIDGTRIAAAPYPPRVGNSLVTDKFFSNGERHKIITEAHRNGRWPANVILDAEAGAMLDAQSGITKSENRKRPSLATRETTRDWRFDNHERAGFIDAGGASRFFYCAKASKSERGGDNDHPTVKPLDLMRWLCELTATPTRGRVLDPFAGSGTTGVASMMTGREFVGIEKRPAAFEIMRRRIARARERLANNQTLFDDET